MFLYKIEAAVSVMHVEEAIKKILDRFFKEYNLPIPRIKIVNQVSSNWLGRCTYNPSVDKNNTTIEIQKRVTADEKSLDRILAHELIHHFEFIMKFGHPELGEKAFEQEKLLRKYRLHDSGHGKTFHEMAAKINAVMGTDYVTEKSDQTYVTELDKEFYVIVTPVQSGKFGYAWMLRPSRNQQEQVQKWIMERKARIFMTKNERFTHGVTIKKFGPVSVPRDEETQKLLKEMYESGKAVTPSWSKITPDKIAASSRFKSIVANTYQTVTSSTKKISLQEAHDRKMFGPVWHGTSPEARKEIEKGGFKIFIGKPRSGDVSNGYHASSYAEGKPAPIHHLGFGIYFTSAKAIAKEFNDGSVSGLKEYYLDVPRLETINFGSPNNMMKWWVQNGYDIPAIYPITDHSLTSDKIEDMRIKATKSLTDALKSKYDAVWFKGKGLKKLLDGDQVCVFDTSRIYEIEPAQAKEGEVGSNVTRKSDGMTGTIMNVEDAKKYRDQWNEPDKPHPWIKPETKKILTVKWKKGGTQHGVQDLDIEHSASKPKKERVAKPKITKQIHLYELDMLAKHMILDLQKKDKESPQDAQLQYMNMATKNGDYFSDLAHTCGVKDAWELYPLLLNAK